MKKNFVLLLGGVLALGLILYFVSPISHPNEAPVEEAESTAATPVEETAAPAPESVPKTAPVPAPTPVKTSEPEGPSPELMRSFAQHLRALGPCLETTNTVPGDELEPSLQTVIDSVRGEWGESVISTEDWMQVEMETPEGEHRRLRVEMDFDNDSQVQRKLKFMTVDQSGQTAPISVPEEQAIEPSDSLIATLESGNRVLSREKFERIYFQNGEEIVARQVNGFVADLEINKGPRTFKCSKMNESSATCQCIP